MANVESQRPRGMSWGGRIDRDTQIVTQEAWYKLRTVEEIVTAFIRHGGNLDRTAKTLNEDYFPDEDVFMTNRQIIEIVGWASRNPTRMIIPLKHG